MQREIEAALDQKVLSLPGLVAKKVNTEKSVGLLASPTTIRARLYHEIVSPQIEQLSCKEQARTEILIRGTVAGKFDVLELKRQVDLFKSNKVILGCTELSVLDNASNRKLSSVDPLKLATQEIFKEKTKV